MTKQAPAPTTPNPPARTRTVSKGVQIGRAIEKLAALNADEARELSESPTTIRQRYDAKRAALLDSLDPTARAAVLAAANAMAPEEVPESE
ncbi:hypothetical protein [Caudoviricetes sp.]|nr:hypothetical protein [Caudoviricetes sp.]